MSRNKIPTEKKDQHSCFAGAELLAPAGSVEALRAAFMAGADAVYIGGDRFGARAYADNPGEQQLLESIDLAHRLGKRLYLTVNTLLKDQELEEELYHWMLPYVREGLDGVIIQDFGAVRLFQNMFPDLPLHASTQMTVTGLHGAEFLQKQGFTRVVPARELSLDEIREIRQKTGLEIETFIHGAMCYAYSGQCLFSSMLGGRSGNRGRCAGICRLPFEVCRADEKFRIGEKMEFRPDGGAGYKPGKREAGRRDGRGARNSGNIPQREYYPLNMKDMCTVEILPELLRAGICSLKIEGRMKKPEYTAGVVSVYRKYLDRYAEHPDAVSWRVEENDLRFLWDLFNRDGFSKSYYFEKNGRDMIALKNEKLDHVRQKAAQELTDRIRRELAAPERQKKLQAPVEGRLVLQEGRAHLELAVCLPSAKNAGSDSRLEISLDKDGVQKAQNQPMTEERVRKQMNKTGGSPFYFSSLDIRMAESLFIPVQLLNEIRREGFSLLEEACRDGFRRSPEINKTGAEGSRGSGEGSGAAESRSGIYEGRCGGEKAGGTGASGKPATADQKNRNGRLPVWAVVETEEQAEVLAGKEKLEGIYLPARLFLEPDKIRELLQRMREQDILPGLALPYILRRDRVKAVRQAADAYLDILDGQTPAFLVRNLEEVGLTAEIFRSRNLDTAAGTILDSMVETMNTGAEKWFALSGFPNNTVSLELNSKEMLRRDNSRSELVVYGRIPLMFSQQCLQKTMDFCSHRRDHLILKDRKNILFPVQCDCGTCTNIIYNSFPTSLLGLKGEVMQTGCCSVRLCFTTEDGKQTDSVADAFLRVYAGDGEPEGELEQTTRGHFHRGIL